MSENQEPTCFVCGILNRYVRLTKHGIVWLCQRCEDAADEMLIEPGVPYNVDMQATS